jgi:hypothetical protein
MSPQSLAKPDHSSASNCCYHICSSLPNFGNVYCATCPSICRHSCDPSAICHLDTSCVQGYVHFSSRRDGQRIRHRYLSVSVSRLGCFTRQYHDICSAGCVIWTVTRVWAGHYGVRFLVQAKKFFTKTPTTSLGPTLWVPATLSPGVKRPRREADRSPPSNTKVENDCSYVSPLPYAVMVCTGTT